MSWRRLQISLLLLLLACGRSPTESRAMAWPRCRRPLNIHMALSLSVQPTSVYQL